MCKHCTHSLKDPKICIIFKSPFNGKELRVSETSTNPVFVAKDICDILEPTRNITGQAISFLKGVGIHHLTISVEGGRSRGYNGVDLNGLYNLIDKYGKLLADEFREWIDRIVLPHIKSKIPIDEPLIITEEPVDTTTTPINLPNQQENITVCNIEPNNTYQELLNQTTIKSSNGLVMQSKKMTINSCTIVMREEDGYVNVSELCKAGKKEFKAWNRLAKSKAFLQVLSNEVKKSTSSLIQYQTGHGSNQSTWAHPQVAINIAQWISPVFDVQVSKWIYELTFTGSVKIRQEKTYEEIETVFKRRAGIDIQRYGETDIFYIGEFDKPEDMDWELEDNQSAFKFGVSSHSDSRESQHDNDKALPNFRFIYAKPCKNGPMASKIEKRSKRVVKRNNMRMNHGTKVECFIATDEELELLKKEIEESAEMYEDDEEKIVDKSQDIEIERIKHKTVVIDLFKDGKLTFAQMMEFLEC
jgi:prophage antirepressor-like protein